MSVDMVCVRVVGEVAWLRGKRWFVLVHCWVSGAARVCVFLIVPLSWVCCCCGGGVLVGGGVV